MADLNGIIERMTTVDMADSKATMLTTIEHHTLSDSNGKAIVLTATDFYDLLDAARNPERADAPTDEEVERACVVAVFGTYNEQTRDNWNKHTLPDTREGVRREQRRVLEDFIAVRTPAGQRSPSQTCGMAACSFPFCECDGSKK